MGIMEINHKKVEVFTDRHKMKSLGKAFVVGAYMNHYWHPYMYSAFHVAYEDGKKDTVLAVNCKDIKM